MDLWCIAGPEGLGDKKIILPTECRLYCLELFMSESEEEKSLSFPGIEDNILKAKQISVKRMKDVFNIHKFAKSVHQNIEYIKDSNNYFCGLNDEKVFIGPVLQVIRRSTFAKLTANKVVFIDKNPMDLKDQYLKNNQLLITPSNEDSKDRLILVFSNGSIIVMAGGFLRIDLPIVLVKANGSYFTISGGLHNHLTLKSGTHVALVIDLETPLPVIFMRLSNQTVKEITEESVVKTESEILKEKSKSDESVTRLDGNEIKVERIIVNDLSDINYIPYYIFDWLKEKGYELESGGDTALLSIGETCVVRRGQRLSNSTPIAGKVIKEEMNVIMERDSKPPKELLIAKSVNHENIIKTLDILCVISELPNKNDIMFSFIVMELGSTQTLDKELTQNGGPLSEDRVKQVFKQLMSAVVYLHNTCQTSHCHIRLDNCIVFEDKTIKLCDFSRAHNMSKPLDLNQSKPMTVKYMPPEFFNTSNPDLFKIDVWMCGCLLFCLLVGNTSPFGDISQEDRTENNDSFKAFLNLQKEGILNQLDLTLKMSEKVINLLSLMFETDPNRRSSAQLVSDHEWLK